MSTLTTEHENRLLGIVRRLPTECVSEVIDFAHLIALRERTTPGDAREHDDSGDTDHDVRWEALLAREDSQDLLESMADEALAEIEAGRTTTVVVTDGGELGPG
ncbi:MAG: hypothetical protein COZ06_15800 [Armatimonadetes bacterium CG_4_10_14_3_um_filter_66_18]|nr:hypothetical protein [Armatimonadota bacterium]OIP09796.1 MAG: hypothetical protein AUJ96_04575 [Armatimonadetes bacterium CG2_30_66_41]PIU93423.1 MAG: hypothetical protein COS65_12885 [Armatimonadetes bacterium CG06_land_8_20_14_3_00_66_21]PIX39853.1 MAG: hypothetical protein COZ57_27310 [Armatimonadetes bacterium CG_4_8_14_3_um_filter_66_20]PIY48717.1 MAG: hypothetical protein COZ06_15800 [Armatimonadetes bacterium CG_4_10_14_3_um_filter_66_18]PIZ31264.1 MAG: hypothetical protein COY42_32